MDLSVMMLLSRFKFTLVRVNEEVSDSRNSLLSEIVERVVTRKSADEQLIAAFKTIQQSEQDIYKDFFSEPLQKLSNYYSTIF